MEPHKAFLASSFWLVLVIFLTISLHGVNTSNEVHHVKTHVGGLVEKDQRRTLFDTEYGDISSIEIKGGHRAPSYHLQFFTLEPNSVFLPVLLHANMVFYVHTGSGRVTWTVEDGGTRRTDLCEGDLFKLNEGCVFYIESNLEAERKKLRIYAMFANTDDTTYDPSIGAYSRINQLVKGFDIKIIQAAFKVPGDLIEAITNKTDTPAIVHANSKEHKTFWELEALVLSDFLGIPSNDKKGKTYNIFDKDPDFKNCNGWSLAVTKKKLKSLKGTNIGFLMVNLTTGSMLGPHWNPTATEIAVVLEGEGMVRVVCANRKNNEDKMEECRNMRFRVKEGDVFVVPRFHPMAQMSFNNDSLVFLGFSTAAKENYPQFLAGKRSVLGALDRHILGTSFGVSNTTIDQLFASQDDSIISGCVSCAEEEERVMKEEERKREEEKEEEQEKEQERARREEEAKREEEQARRQQEKRERRREKEARREHEKGKEEEEEEAEREREGGRKAHRRERKHVERREEEEAQREQEQARRQQEEREKRREQESGREKEEEGERGRRGGVRPHRRGDRGRSREEQDGDDVEDKGNRSSF
ncbi:PREDICTED: vicilin-like seed storage protein At2g18540 isoform X2 [Lupinus angustifolius]|uniref:vicilin-like seed storage protein At2g18540 isoform X2 n=1 Tax=Lupinus angustifolius TaxID=3871 RepID=UPI00092F5206|nr:PREDICTED: vicilin-like seed storage protein At2g18540 isoform X2 [Lupinus angustifolius]